MQTTTTLRVRIVYPSAHRPAEGDFTVQTTVGEVKQFALNTFGVKEGSDPENPANQVVFFLFHERAKLKNLGQPIGELRNGNQQQIVFRLIREVIVG